LKESVFIIEGENSLVFFGKNKRRQKKNKMDGFSTNGKQCRILCRQVKENLATFLFFTFFLLFILFTDTPQ